MFSEMLHTKLTQLNPAPQKLSHWLFLLSLSLSLSTNQPLIAAYQHWSIVDFFNRNFLLKPFTFPHIFGQIPNLGFVFWMKVIVYIFILPIKKIKIKIIHASSKGFSLERFLMFSKKKKKRKRKKEKENPMQVKQ